MPIWINKSRCYYITRAILFWWGKGNEEKRFSIRTEEGLEKDESDLAD